MIRRCCHPRVGGGRCAITRPAGVSNGRCSCSGGVFGAGHGREEKRCGRLKNGKFPSRKLRDRPSSAGIVSNAIHSCAGSIVGLRYKLSVPDFSTYGPVPVQDLYFSGGSSTHNLISALWLEDHCGTLTRERTADIDVIWQASLSDDQRLERNSYRELWDTNRHIQLPRFKDALRIRQAGCARRAGGCCMEMCHGSRRSG